MLPVNGNINNGSTTFVVLNNSTEKLKEEIYSFCFESSPLIFQLVFVMLLLIFLCLILFAIRIYTGVLLKCNK